MKTLQWVHLEVHCQECSELGNLLGANHVKTKSMSSVLCVYECVCVKAIELNISNNYDSKNTESPISSL